MHSRPRSGFWAPVRCSALHCTWLGTEQAAHSFGRIVCCAAGAADPAPCVARSGDAAVQGRGQNGHLQRHPCASLHPAPAVSALQPVQGHATCERYDTCTATCCLSGYATCPRPRVKVVPCNVLPLAQGAGVWARRAAVPRPAPRRHHPRRAGRRAAHLHARRAGSVQVGAVVGSGAGAECW